MRILALMLGLVVGSVAHADVSDSGNLSIGGYAAIGGTMTVAGGLDVSGPSTAAYFYGNGASLTGIQSLAVSSRSWNMNGISGTQTTYTAVVSTVVITASGVNPVMVCFSGPIDIAANGGTGWGFLMDGHYIDSLSPSIGVTFGGVYGSSLGWVKGDASSCYMVQTSDVALGAHSFGFAPAGNGGTWKLGYMNGSSVSEARFFVYELH